MNQIVLNYFIIFVIPIIIGFVVRFFMNRFNKAYLVTIVFGALTLFAWIVSFVVDSHGSEMYGIRALQTTTMFISSFLLGFVFKLRLKNTSSKNK